MEPNVAVAGWPDQAETFLSFINSYRTKDMFCDCTLACDRKFFRAHRMVLSMCSEFFENIFSNAQDKNPVIILNEVEAWQLECLLNYMYKGETSVPDALFNSLCRVAKCLQIKGFDMVELHRKAVKMTKQVDSSCRSLERTSDSNYTDNYLPSSDSMEYRTHKFSSDFKDYSSKSKYGKEFEEHCKDFTKREKTSPLLSLLRLPPQTREEYSRQEGSRTPELISESYRESPQSSIPRKTFKRRYNPYHSEISDSSRWFLSQADFPRPSFSPTKPDTPSSAPNRDCESAPNADRPSYRRQSFCYKEEDENQRFHYNSSHEATCSSASPSREKDNKENETTPIRRSPPHLLPSKILKNLTMEVSSSNPGGGECCESQDSDQPLPTPSLAHQRGPPPLLKLINNEFEEDEPLVEVDEATLKHEPPFILEPGSPPTHPNSFLRPVPYLEPSLYHSRSESPKNTLLITPVGPKSLEYIKSKSVSPQGSRDSPLNLSSEDKSKSVGYPSPSQESGDPLLRKIQTNRRKRVRGPKSWEFLLRLLRDPLSNPSLIKWEDESNGVFRLIRPEVIAQRWGRRTGKHGNDILSYESFARGLRYHYATGALNAVSEKSFVYQFGPKAQKTLFGVEKIPENDEPRLDVQV